MTAQISRVKLGVCLRALQSGDLVRARALLEKLVVEHPEDEAGWNALGAVRYEQGEYLAAREAFERCVALAPRHPLAHASLGELALRIEHDASRAKTHLMVALAADGAGLEKIQQWCRVLLLVAERKATQPQATSARASTPR